jgi:hypothetical protein
VQLLREKSGLRFSDSPLKPNLPDQVGALPDRSQF